MPPDSELQNLRDQVAHLTRRVYRLEQAARAAGVELESEAAPPASGPLPSAAAIPPPIAAPEMPLITAPLSAATAASDAERPGLESIIGSQWLNRIGIVACLIGVSYFLKFAFENNWIGPTGRIAIGLLAGIAVVVWSERFRLRGYRGFSFSLKAVGIGVLYLSLWAAFQLYQLMSSGVTFGAMVFVTAATALMALQQDAEILAAFALVGGFVTPVLVSTHQNHEIALFSYLAVLDLAALVLIAEKPWRRILFGSFIGTLLLYIAWYSDYYDRAQIGPTFTFATLFFAIFAASPLVASRAEAERAERSVRPSALILLLPLLNAAVYFFQGYAMLDGPYPEAKAWFALALAAVFIVLSRVSLAGRGDAEVRDLRLLHVAIAVGFVTVAIPLKAEQHWITIGWFVEAGALYWVGRRTDSGFLRGLATAALALGIVRLLFVDNFHTTRLVLNARMATYAVAIVVMGMLASVGTGLDEEQDAQVRGAAVIAINLLALLAFGHEIADGFSRAMRGTYGEEARTLSLARDFSYSALCMIYGAGLMFVGFWKRSAFLRWQALVLIALTVGKVFIYDVSELDRVYRILSFIVLGVLLLTISFAYQRDWLKLGARSGGAAKA